MNVRGDAIVDTERLEELIREAGEDDPLYLLSAGLMAVLGERDRARLLAAKLEEVVAMRTAVCRALADWDGQATTLAGIRAWAIAQLEEVP